MRNPSQTLASVLKDAPDWSSIAESLPTNVALLMRRCLEKKPRARLHSIADARIELQEWLSPPQDVQPILESTHPEKGESRTTKNLLRTVGWVASILATATVTWLTVGLFDRRPPAPAFESTTELRIRQLTGRPSSDTVHTASLSPDGEQLAFATQEGLFLQLVATGEERLLPLADDLQVLEIDWLGATNLLFSASTADGFGLYKTSIFGGATRKLADGTRRAAVIPDGNGHRLPRRRAVENRDCIGTRRRGPTQRAGPGRRKLSVGDRLVSRRPLASGWDLGRRD